MSNLDKLDEDEEDEILTVHPDGQVEIFSTTSRMSNRSSLIDEKMIVKEESRCETAFEEPVFLMHLEIRLISQLKVTNIKVTKD